MGKKGILRLILKNNNKKRVRMLKYCSGWKFEVKQDYLDGLKVLPHKWIFNYKRKDSNFAVY